MTDIKFIGTNQVELVNSLNENDKLPSFSTGEDFIEFKFTEPLSKNNVDYYHFVITGSNVQVSGRIWSVNKKQQFINLFKDCTQISDASQLNIVASDLKEACFANMFLNCTNLTTSPWLGTKNLAPWCYSGMFAGCTSLTSAPALPASTLAPYCYYAMFYNCRSLSTAPVLSASTLVDWCYNSMFYNCTSLKSISANFTEWKGNATSSWVTNVSPTGVFTNNNRDFEEIVGNSNIPIGWEKDSDYLTFYSPNSFALKFQDMTNSYTKQIKFREINPSTNKWYPWRNLGTTMITRSGYIQISGDATHLSGNYRAVVSASNSAYDTVKVYGKVNSLINFDKSVEEKQYYKLFKSCSSIIDASELVLPHTELAPSCYMDMFNDCKKLSAAPQLPATDLATDCYNSMFIGCRSLSTAPVLSATDLASGCYWAMFEACSSLLTAPSLPATTLVTTCYDYMFDGCNSLTSINVNFTDWNEGKSTYAWLLGVNSVGTFYKPTELPEEFNTIYDPRWIPTGWTVINK